MTQPELATRLMTGAQALVARLDAHGVDTVYGLPGEENLAVVEALAASAIDFVATRHEQHAAFMAATRARLTGSPGVVLATLGPGALNLFTGLAHAQLGGMPLIAITGQKPVRDNEEGSFQVVDVPSAAKPITKLSRTVADVYDVAGIIDEAFTVANDSRPGAVLVELPEDVAGAEMPVSLSPIPVIASRRAGSEAISAAAELINSATNPVILAGSGAGRIADHLQHFVEATGLGLVATQMGKGALSEAHPQSLRSLGIHRPDYSHLAILPADVVVAVGYEPVEHPPLAWNPNEDKAIIHLAQWPASRERGYRPTHELVGDPGRALTGLRDAIDPRSVESVNATRKVIEDCLAAERSESVHPPSPLDVVRAVESVLGDRDIVALDNGVYKIWFARHYRSVRPDSVLLDNALATMGAGLATAMAAAHLYADRGVLAVCGDGGFLMNVQDLETARRLGLDLTILVLRDDEYGFIAWHQDEQGRPNDGVRFDNPDLTLLAKAFGATSHTVGPGNLEATLRLAMSEGGISLIDCQVDYAINDVLGQDLYARAREALETS